MRMIIGFFGFQGFFGIETFDKNFFGWFDSSRNFWGYSKQTEKSQ